MDVIMRGGFQQSGSSAFSLIVSPGRIAEYLDQRILAQNPIDDAAADEFRQD